MVQLVVRVVDSPLSGDPRKDAGASRRGDVIVVVAGDWEWGPREMTGAQWRILRFPSVSWPIANILVQPEIESDPRVIDPILRFRGAALDLESDLFATPELAAYMADGTRAASLSPLMPGVSDTDLFNAMIMKPPSIQTAG